MRDGLPSALSAGPARGRARRRKGRPSTGCTTTMELMVLVAILVCHGSPTQAIVAAFGLDERMVAAWLHRAGDRAARAHATVVEAGQMDLGQAQVDEICVNVRKGRIWRRPR